MSDEVVRLSTIAQLLRRRWAALVACAVLGGAVGAGLSPLVSPGYEATTSVLLQGKNAEDALPSAPRLATSSIVLDQVSKTLPWHPGADRLLDAVSAEAGDGNVVTITAAASNPGRAKQLANQVATEYIDFSDRLATTATGSSAQNSKQQQAQVRNRITETDRRLGDLLAAVHSGTAGDVSAISTRIDGLRSALDKAASTLEQLDTPDEPISVVVIGQARTPTEQAPPTLPQCIAAGAALFLLLGIAAHLVAARTDRRLQRGTDIAAALGTRLLGTLDVTAGRDRSPSTRRGARRHRILHGDPPWTLPVHVTEVGAQPTRYRRVLSRIANTGEPGTPVLVVLAADDTAAHQAFEGLSTVAGAREGAGTADVASGKASGARRVLDGHASNGTATRAGTGLAVSTALPGTGGHGPVVLHSADIRGDRPTVPDDAVHGGTIAIVTAGTSTPWQLMGIAESCLDAGRELRGVVVTHRARRSRARGRDTDRSGPS